MKSLTLDDFINQSESSEGNRNKIQKGMGSSHGAVVTPISPPRPDKYTKRFNESLKKRIPKTIINDIKGKEPRPHPLMSDPYFIQKIEKWKRGHRIEQFEGMSDRLWDKWGEFLEKIVKEWNEREDVG